MRARNRRPLARPHALGLGRRQHFRHGLLGLGCSFGEIGDGSPERRQLIAVGQRNRIVETAGPAFFTRGLRLFPWAGHDRSSILFIWDAAKSSRSRVKRS
jgi:hypothetical protein